MQGKAECYICHESNETLTKSFIYTSYKTNDAAVLKEGLTNTF